MSKDVEVQSQTSSSNNNNKNESLDGNRFKATVWSTNDTDRLYKLAQDIELQDGWRSYLSVQEHEFFKYALDHGKEYWKRFIDGKISCKVEHTTTGISTSTVTDTSPITNNTHLNGIASLTPRLGTPQSSVDPRSSLLQSNDAISNSVATSIMNGTHLTSRSSLTPQPPSNISYDPLTISFRVRYMLYEKSIDILYPALDNQPPGFDLSILEEDEEQQPEAQPNKVMLTRKVDDNYDDEEDDEDEEETQKTEINDVNESSDQSDTIIIKRKCLTFSLLHEIFYSNHWFFLDDGLVDDEAKKIKQAIRSFHKTYQIFEDDRELALKQRKLEESDRQVDNDIILESADSKQNSSTAQFGAANLSLKHLLATIESKRYELQLSDFELRNLISDVRKNRSKWASEEKIGQEELYEAAEKVVLELRGYTEHSTAFLNKVNKRDAPNYFNVIKHPMDLNSVMKKLKGFQYKSKDEFVSDLMLIWKNCLTYNTDPKHFLRIHAIAMHKKTLELIPLIPDITIRDRADVEAEDAAQNSAIEQANGETRTSRKGIGKHPTKKGKKRKLDEQEHEQIIEREESPNGRPTNSNNGNGVISRSSPFVRRDSTPRLGTPAGFQSDIDSELNQSAIIEESEEVEENKSVPKDLESETWQKLFTKQKSIYGCHRGDLFKDNRLKMDAEAILRKPQSMGKFKTILNNKEEEESEQQQQQQYQQQQLSQPLRRKTGTGSTLMDMLDDKPFIVEYEVGSGLPELPWSIDGDNEEDDELLLDSFSSHDLPEHSGYIAKTGLAMKINENLDEMQQIRKICSKIGYIRQLQQQTHSYNVTFKPYNPQKITDVDLDLESRLPNRDELDSAASQQALKKSIAKVSMHTGFEVTELMALNTLTEVAGDYLTNLGKTLMMYMESSMFEGCSLEDLIVMTLQQQGIESLSSLDLFVRDDVDRHGLKLQELKRQLKTFLADLLRPQDPINESHLNNGSNEQFFNGDVQEIDDDFFGFKELGLDKEFGLLSSSVPFHLLQARFSTNNPAQIDSRVDNNRLSDVPDYAPMDHNLAQVQIGLLRPFYITKIEQNRNHGEMLLEGDQLAPKHRNTRPKVPPTGKIPGTKKKPLNKVYFKPNLAEPFAKQVVESKGTEKPGLVLPTSSTTAAAPENGDNSSSLMLDGLDDSSYLNNDDSLELFGQ